MSKPKSYSKEYKFKVSLEMIKGELSMSEIISKYEVPRSVLHKWKKQLLDKGSSIFSKSSLTKNHQATEISKLHAAIGRLKVENDFLQETSERLGL